MESRGLADQGTRQNRAVRRRPSPARRHLLRRVQLRLRPPPRRKFKVSPTPLRHRGPEELRPASFVDIEADTCLIPPNSFALAETVEYLEVRATLWACASENPRMHASASS